MASDTGGVKTFSIQGRLYRERERLIGMSDAERAWRKQWVKDQVLSHSEPRHVPELYKEMYNPIRRAYWIPLNALAKALTPVMGESAAKFTRVVTGKLLMGLFAVYAGTYYFKYNGNDWTRKGGWRAVASRPACVPGDPGYPQKGERTEGSDYASRGFKHSPL